MVIRAHGDLPAVHLVGYAVIEWIGDDKNIPTADGFKDNALSLPRREAGAVRMNNVVTVGIVPFPDVVLDLVTKRLAPFHTNKP